MSGRATKCYIGFGSNLGARHENLRQGLALLAKASRYPESFRTSPLFESQALVPEGSPSAWNKSYLNGVLEFFWDESPRDLFNLLKDIEKTLGRSQGPRWAPRSLDLDLLLFGEEVIQERDLQIPHPEMSRRRFVLDPLKHLAPSLIPPGWTKTILAQSRELPKPLPLWMGIVNLTPDSFSDGGLFFNPENSLSTGASKELKERLDFFANKQIQWLDLGAESTRPGATLVSPEEEWQRLAPALAEVARKFGSQDKGNFFRPWFSIDTRHPQTALRAMEFGVNIINDVGGLASSNWWPLLAGASQRRSSCQGIFMHSLGLPADPNQVLSADEDPIQTLKLWAKERITTLTEAGVSMDQLIFDPGIGFGKSASQSLEILRRFDEFMDLPVRILIGASRKSFLNLIGESSGPRDRDWKSLGIALSLAERGCDILRVHEPTFCHETHFALRELL